MVWIGDQVNIFSQNPGPQVVIGNDANNSRIFAGYQRSGYVLFCHQPGKLPNGRIHRTDQYIPAKTVDRFVQKQ